MKNIKFLISIFLVIIVFTSSKKSYADWVVDSCKIVIDSNTQIHVKGSILCQNKSKIQNDGTIIIEGDCQNVGNILQLGKNVIIAGSKAQNMNGNIEFENLEIAKTGNSVFIHDEIFIKRYLFLSSGVINTNDHVTLLSDSISTAIIPGIGLGQVVGKINMQKYMPSSMGYHYLCSPFPGAPIAELGDDLNLILGNPYINNDTNNTVYPFPTVFEYDETYPQPTMSLGWDHPGNSMQEMRGYAANFGYNLMPSTIDIQWNYEHLTSKGINVTNTPSGIPSIDGWNLVGNPFPSSIDWDAAGWTKTNVANAIYFFRPTSQFQGAYATYVNGIGTPFGTNAIISPMQGFLVKAVGNGLLQATNDVRINTLNPVFYKTSNAFPIIRLLVKNSSGIEASDETVIYFDQAASILFDQNLDASKLMNTNDVPNLYSRSENENLSINALPYPLTQDVVVPLRCNVSQTGSYSFEAIEIENFDAGTEIYIEDIEQGTFQNLKTKPTYTAHISPSSKAERFFLHFCLPGISANSEKIQGNINAFSSNKVLYVDLNMGLEEYQLEFYNISGNQVLKSQKRSNGQHTFDFNFASTGIYFVRITYNNNTTIKKFLIQ